MELSIYVVTAVRFGREYYEEDQTVVVKAHINEAACKAFIERRNSNPTPTGYGAHRIHTIKLGGTRHLQNLINNFLNKETC